MRPKPNSTCAASGRAAKCKVNGVRIELIDGKMKCMPEPTQHTTELEGKESDLFALLLLAYTVVLCYLLYLAGAKWLFHLSFCPPFLEPICYWFFLALMVFGLLSLALSPICMYQTHTAFKSNACRIAWFFFCLVWLTTCVLVSYFRKEVSDFIPNTLIVTAVAVSICLLCIGNYHTLARSLRSNLHT